LLLGLAGEPIGHLLRHRQDAGGAQVCLRVGRAVVLGRGERRGGGRGGRGRGGRSRGGCGGGGGRGGRGRLLGRGGRLGGGGGRGVVGGLGALTGGLARLLQVLAQLVHPVTEILVLPHEFRELLLDQVEELVDLVLVVAALA